MFFTIGIAFGLAVLILLLLTSGGGGLAIALGLPALIVTATVLWYAMRGRVRH